MRMLNQKKKIIFFSHFFSLPNTFLGSKQSLDILLSRNNHFIVLTTFPECFDYAKDLDFNFV